MNITPFNYDLENIIFLPGTWILEEKSAFINSCDFMIHARIQGETFGCAIAEFSMENKPVITYRDSRERAHIEILREKGIYYSNKEELLEILDNIKNYVKYDDYSQIYTQFSPEIIINKFKKIFLDE